MKNSFLVLVATLSTFVFYLLAFLVNPILRYAYGYSIGEVTFKTISHIALQNLMVGGIAPLLIVILLYINYKKETLSKKFALAGAAFTTFMMLLQAWWSLRYIFVPNPYIRQPGELGQGHWLKLIDPLISDLYPTISIIVTLIAVYYLVFRTGRLSGSPLLNLIGKIFLYLIIVLILAFPTMYILLILSCALTGNCL